MAGSFIVGMLCKVVLASGILFIFLATITFEQNKKAHGKLSTDDTCYARRLMLFKIGVINHYSLKYIVLNGTFTCLMIVISYGDTKIRDL